MQIQYSNATLIASKSIHKHSHKSFELIYILYGKKHTRFCRKIQLNICLAIQTIDGKK